MDKRPIGIFDSGVGALSSLHELIKLLPNENYIFFADSGHNPYGERTKRQLLILSDIIGDFLVKHDVKMIVIACNTMTAASLSHMQEKFNIPIIGVITSGAIGAVNATKNKKIGILATTFTAKNHAYKNEILKVIKNDPSYTVYEEGSKTLANAIETIRDTESIIKEFTTRFKDNVDTLILGCTHYPLAKDLFRKYFKGEFIIDPAVYTSLEVKRILEEKNALNNSNEGYKLKCYVTEDPEFFKKVAGNLTKLDISDTTCISIEDQLIKRGFYN